MDGHRGGRGDRGRGHCIDGASWVRQWPTDAPCDHVDDVDDVHHHDHDLNHDDDHDVGANAQP